MSKPHMVSCVTVTNWQPMGLIHPAHILDLDNLVLMITSFSFSKEIRSAGNADLLSALHGNSQLEQWRLRPCTGRHSAISHKAPPL